MELIINSGTLTKAHESDAGFDIHASEDQIILPRESAKIPTNLKITLPQGTCGLVKPRSGLSFSHDLETGAGVIDETYSGEIKVHLYNFSDQVYQVHKGDKIAQLLIVPIAHPFVITTDESTYHGPEGNIRTDNGFGSSGK